MKRASSDRDRDPDQLLSTSDVARLLQISSDMVRYLERRRKLPAQYVGARRARVFRFDDVEKLAFERGVVLAQAS